MMDFNMPKCIKMHVRASWFSKNFWGYPRIPKLEGGKKQGDGRVITHQPEFDINRHLYSSASIYDEFDFVFCTLITSRAVALEICDCLTYIKHLSSHLVIIDSLASVE